MTSTTLAALALQLAAAAPPELIPELQLRPRLEADSGRDGVSDDGNVGFVTMRSRLGATLKQGDVSGRVVISDARTFGEEQHTRRDFAADGLDVRIATLTWTPGDFELQIGRIERSLHAERLLAIANWRQPGRSFDGARGRYATDRWAVEARAYLLREGDNHDFAAADQVTPGGRDGGLFLLTGGLEDDAVLQPLVMWETDGEAQLDRITTGVFAEGSRGDLHGRADAYLQVGQLGTDPIRAGLFAVRGWWQTEGGSLGAGYEVLSGDRDPASGTVSAFSAPYAANHRYYGHIDMVTFLVGAQADGQGLHDALITTTWTPTEGLDLLIDVHTMLAAVPTDSTLLAVEPDLATRVHLAEPLTWTSGLNLWIAPDPDAFEFMAFSMLDLRL